MAGERRVDVEAMIEACERAGRAYRETGERLAERIQRIGREASAAALPRKAPWWKRAMERIGRCHRARNAGLQ